MNGGSLLLRLSMTKKNLLFYSYGPDYKRGSLECQGFKQNSQQAFGFTTNTTQLGQQALQYRLNYLASQQILLDI